MGKSFQILRNVYSLIEKRTILISVCVDEKKLAGKKQNIDPTRKILMTDVDLGEPTPFLDQFYLGCTERECQISEDIVDNYKILFESRISAGAMEKLTETKATRKPDAETISSWSCDMEGHAKKCVERKCEFANKTTEQTYKVATPCMDEHQLKRRKWISWRIIYCLLTNCSEMSFCGTC